MGEERGKVKWGWGSWWVRGDAPLPPTEIGILLSSFAGAVVVDGALAVMSGASSGTAMAGKYGGEFRDRYCGASRCFSR